MEKIEFKYRGEGLYITDENHWGDYYGSYYRAADVDALLSDVRRLVEEGKKLLDKYCEEVEIEKDFSGDGCKCYACEVSKAIAAVERHL